MVKKKKTLAFFFRFLTSSIKLLLISVKNDFASIFHENGSEDNDIVFKLQLFEKVNSVAIKLTQVFGHKVEIKKVIQVVMVTFPINWSIYE